MPRDLKRNFNDVSDSPYALRQAGLTGLLLALAPGALLTVINPSALLTPGLTWAFGNALAAFISIALTVAAVIYLPGNSRRGLALLFTAMGVFSLGAVPRFTASPSATLLWIVTIVLFVHFLRNPPPGTITAEMRNQAAYRLQMAKWAAPVPALLALAALSVGDNNYFNRVPLAASLLIGQVLLLGWLLHPERRPRRFAHIFRLTLVVLFMLGTILAFAQGNIRSTALLLSIPLFLSLILFRNSASADESESVWLAILSHPERILISTFLGLCLMGTVLLLLPLSARHSNGVAPIDAAFMATSAVCVTGLAVFELSSTLTLAGQIFMLLLIQLGGLGIMSSAAVFMHIIGQKLSLRQESILTSITDSSRGKLMESLILVLRFTFAVEALGAALLTVFFTLAGLSPLEAAWQGIFTAVSAFCNAGFMLNASSLVPYQNYPLILHTVGALIICGGLAPAATLAIPLWLRRRPVSLTTKIALVTTAALLVFGTLVLLALEWNTSLSGLTMLEKAHNAWFQAVALRTAGFNSINIGSSGSPAYLIMMFLMFIGGSPGSTAGGIKTTTLGVLALTFWTGITGRKEIIAGNRRIAPSAVYQAAAITFSGMIVLFAAILMLELTQQIPAPELAFEAVSALGTVGFSIGATGSLDFAGKFIIMLAMFVGRVGPLTLFMLLSDDQPVSGSGYPEAHITLT